MVVLVQNLVWYCVLRAVYCVLCSVYLVQCVVCTWVYSVQCVLCRLCILCNGCFFFILCVLCGVQCVPFQAQLWSIVYLTISSGNKCTFIVRGTMGVPNMIYTIYTYTVFHRCRRCKYYSDLCVSTPTPFRGKRCKYYSDLCVSTPTPSGGKRCKRCKYHTDPCLNTPNSLPW